jgi:hypothetical protein
MRGMAKGFLVAGVVVLGAAGCDSGGHDLVRNQAPGQAAVHQAVLDKAGLQYYWTRQASMDRRDAVEQIVLLDEHLYFITKRKSLLAVDAAVGNKKWELSVADLNEKVFPPTHVNGMILSQNVLGSESIQTPPELKDQTGDKRIRKDIYDRILRASVGQAGIDSKVLDELEDPNVDPTTREARRHALIRRLGLEPADVVAEVDRALLKQFNAVAINSVSACKVLDRDTGTVYRDFKFHGSKATDQGVCGDRWFFYGGVEHYAHAVQLLQAVPISQKLISEIIKAPMRRYDNRVFLGTMAGSLIALSADNFLLPRWRISVDGPITLPFHVGPRGLFLPCSDNRVYGIDPQSGYSLWPPIQTAGTLADEIQVSDLSVLQYARGDGLYAINIANGEVRWKRPAWRKVLAAMQDNLYVLDKDRNLVICNEITGEPIQTLPLTGFQHFALNTKAPAIYAATNAGYAVCIRLRSAGRLRAEDLTK